MRSEKLSPKNDLTTIPGVGPSIAQDLLDVGIRRVSQLRRKNPEAIYEAVCALRGEPQDRCLLYVFRCAVYYAGARNPDPEKLKWWNWKDGPITRSSRRVRRSA